MRKLFYRWRIWIHSRSNNGRLKFPVEFFVLFHFVVKRFAVYI